ncbi:hypothetical protein ES703_23500 [subsurface metagenome]
MAITQTLIDGWSLMPESDRVAAVEKELAKIRAKAAGDAIEEQSKEAQKEIDKQMKESLDAGEDYFPNEDGLSEEDLRKKKIKDRTDKYFEPMD